MIKTKQDLKEYIESDNSWYKQGNWKWRLIDRFTKPVGYVLKKYLKLLRKCEYYKNNSAGSRFNTYMGYYYERRKNRLGQRLGIEIGINCFGKGLQLWHCGSIVVNPNVRAGENCVLRGANCIGNNGTVDINPVIGNNVELGYGAVIIGGVEIADGTKIGANSVVNKSITEPNGTYVGAPAKRLEPKKTQEV